MLRTNGIGLEITFPITDIEGSFVGVKKEPLLIIGVRL